MASIRRGRLAVYGTLLAACVPCASMVCAQVIPVLDPPPIRSAVDQNGVNLVTGEVLMSTTDLAIGSPGSGGLAHTRTWTGNGWRYNFFLGVQATDTGVLVSIGSDSASFTLSGGVYTSDKGDGSTLTDNGTSYTYVASDGTTVLFDAAAGPLFNGYLLGIGKSITLPSNEKITLTYKPFGIPGFNTVRLQSVNNSSGYQLKFGYQSADQFGFFNLTSVTGINNAVDYCDPAGDSCSGLTQIWPTITYSIPAVVGSNIQQTVTDALSHVTRYTYSTAGLIGIKLPSSSTDNFTFSYGSDGRVSSVSNGTATWNYAWSLSGTTLTATVTDPLSHQQVTTSDTNTLVILTYKDALNHTSTYKYDTKGRLTYSVPPEGTIDGSGNPTAGYQKFEYDTRGNVTCSMKVSKTASGAQSCALPSTTQKIVTTASYPTTCSNAFTCNKPTSTTDALGRVTDYTYDGTTGLLASVTLPAPVLP